MKRDIGLLGLTFISVGGIIGSGWLFGPLLAVQHAGPASKSRGSSVRLAMFVLAITFAEISAMLPIPGGIARVSAVFARQYRLHGNGMDRMDWLQHHSPDRG